VCIKQAEKVLFLLADAAPAADIWIRKLNINSESLHDCYIHGEHVIMHMIEWLNVFFRMSEGG